MGDLVGQDGFEQPLARRSAPHEMQAIGPPLVQPFADVTTASLWKRAVVRRCPSEPTYGSSKWRMTKAKSSSWRSIFATWR